MLRFIYWFLFGGHIHHWYVINEYEVISNSEDKECEEFDKLGYIHRCSECGELKQEVFEC